MTVEPFSALAVDQASLSAAFQELFGTTPLLFRAPGRVNLIGEHTDYNDGFVMPCALNLSCWIAAARRDDRRIVVRSMNADDTGAFNVDDPPARTGGWTDYVAGVSHMLGQHGVAAGANLLICSDVPAGAGLSSSAALEVAVATALIDLAGTELEPATIARLCQQAENEVVGAPVGIMDQFVATHARAGHALVLDCRSLQHRQVPLPSWIRIVACNSMVRHSNVRGPYNDRRGECRAALATLSERVPGLASLRDADLTLLDKARTELGDVLFRRARHVVTENARVIRAAAALDAGDFDTLAALMADSHRSLRDDFEVSVPELDLLVATAAEHPGVYGARMTGGGFGGCTVNLVHEEAVETFRRRILEQYETGTGVTPAVYVSIAAGAAEPIDA
jgi:galactokinase